MADDKDPRLPLPSNLTGDEECHFCTALVGKDGSAFFTHDGDPDGVMHPEFGYLVSLACSRCAEEEILTLDLGD